MTYLDWVNAFWRVDEAVHFTGNQTRLYFCLLDIFNRARWPGEISYGDRLLAARAGISLNAFKRARDTLSQHGLIQHHPGGPHHRNLVTLAHLRSGPSTTNLPSVLPPKATKHNCSSKD